MSDLDTKYQVLRERFISRLPDRLSKLERYLAEWMGGSSESHSAFKREAHSLVGAAGLHRMDALAETAQQLEQLSDTEPPVALQAIMASLAQRIANPEAPPEPVENENRHGKARVALLCQDEEELANQQILLERAGYSVSSFTQPNALLKHLPSGTAIDLIILGLQFEGDDCAGLELLSELGKQLPTTPVIVFSARHDMLTQLSAYAGGASAFIAKPLSADMLLDTVSSTLVRQHMTRIKVIAHGGSDEMQESLIRIALQANIALEVHTEIHDFVTALTTPDLDATILLDPCPSPGLSVLVRLINNQPIDRRLPLLVIRPKPNLDLSADWLSTTLRSRIADQSSAHALASRNRTQLYEHERQRLALDQHAVISIADQSGSIIESSKHLDKILGWPRTAIIGSHLWIPLPDRAPPEFNRQTIDIAINEGLWAGEVQLKSRSGQTVWFRTTLVPFLDARGKPYRYMVIRNDITQRKLAEQAVLASKAQESELASRMQSELLLPALSGCYNGMAVASHFAAANGMGGDFLAMVEHDSRCYDFLIGDVMGKGLHAAIVGAAVKLELHRCLFELKRNERLPTPAEVILALDTSLRNKLQTFECFVTLAYVRCDLDNKLITHVGCGHPETLLISDRAVSRLSNHHPPMGMVAIKSLEQTTTPWPAGASLFLYSDGLTESSNPNGEMLGDDELIEAITHSEMASLHPMAMAATALELATRHQGVAPQRDDWSLIAIRCPNDHEQQFELPAVLTSLAPLRQTIVAQAQGTVDVALIDRATLVSTEVFSNIVRHGLRSQKREQDQIGIRLRCSPGSIALSYHYHGVPFEPNTDQTLPEPEQLSEGGLGLPLIFTLSDHIHYTHADGLCSCAFDFQVERT